jgi:hypothetical protein
MDAANFIHEHNESQLLKSKGSTRPHKDNFKPNWEGGHIRLYKDYFHPIEPLFLEYVFRRYFWMSRNLLLTILDGMRDHDSYFKFNKDATSKLGSTSHKKCSTTIHMPAYELPMISLMIICAWASPHALSRCTTFARQWLRCLEKFTWVSQMWPTLPDCLEKSPKMLGSTLQALGGKGLCFLDRAI